ncbi:uridine kinase [Clostridium botulinum]|uniref:Uridine kinase n=1 Tax=Clostridium botulinum TaxID=1491 RepID=A0A0C2NWS7_CLOBO|nr:MULTISPECIES: uridine kinase [Clostridium]ACD50984.1 uridine kinase [Clostridium botulinum E3 str. Alaska E43]AJF29010.1 uridine kinase [Clostridium botulinum]AJF32071.1 uridine kinase [Clostridium botulinum]EES47991.1 uridine kinase [Clostridium botulinum E1 str. 'BoNT E Beluga']KAI3350339.1 uridine kinase [Clostridium botulinum]
MQDIMVIGIAGGTGSGKTTLSLNIKEEFGDDVVILSHDYYYRSNDNISLEERKKLNYDHPNSFETDLLIEHLKMLKNGETINHPVYSFVEHTRTTETVMIKPARVIIVEGILIFENQELCDLMDIKVFVDTDADVRIIRRLLRDVQERGRDLDSVINQYLTTVKPMHEEFVDPSKKRADIIIPEGGCNTVALSMLLERIRSFI